MPADLQDTLARIAKDRIIVDDIFGHHAATQEQLEQIAHVRESAKDMALTIMAQCPPSADRTAALRKLREAMMTANAAIVLEGRSI